MSQPLRMVALGDSIVWGQGLTDEQKFSTSVRRWLTEKTGRPCDLQVFAHSRAVIEPDEIQDTRSAKPGEVPNKHPSITAQARQVPEPGTVDLVLIDGGINDMGAQEILNPLRAGDLNWIRSEASVHCGRIGNLLTETVCPRFSKAIIVVSGYYPLLSEQSDPLRVGELLAGRDLGVARSTIRGALLAPLAAQSAAWAEASNATFNTAVARTGEARVAFAPVAFAPEQCYAAAATWLWTLGEKDSVVIERQRQCRQFAPLDPLCPFEAAFHPNRKGAAAYADAVIKVLDRFVATLSAS